MGTSNAVFAAAVLALIAVASVGYGLFGRAPTTTTSTVTTGPTTTQTETIVRTYSQTYTTGSTVTVTSTATSTATITVTMTTTVTTSISVTTTVTSTQSSVVSVSYVSIMLGAGSDTSSNGYAPANLVVVLGVNNTVLWVNNDRVAHTVSSSSSSQPFNSGNLDPGKTYTYTFTKPGTYQYYCIYHGWMYGTITVRA